MKKILIVSLALLFFLGPLAACGKTAPPPSPETFFGENEPRQDPPSGAETPSEEAPEEDFKEDLGGDLGGEAVKNEPPVSEGSPYKTYLLVTASSLNVRRGASLSSAVLGAAQRGALLPLCGEREGWCETRYRGETAFVARAHVSPLELEGADERTERVIAEGERLLGTPYVYGAVRCHDGFGTPLAGFSEGKFDCSSLMQYIFLRGAGVLLQTTTRTQIAQGVRAEPLKRGDLLFFTNASRAAKTGIERVGHVALYLGGNYILHTASDFAKIEEISPARWNYFLEARRVL